MAGTMRRRPTFRVQYTLLLLVAAKAAWGVPPAGPNNVRAVPTYSQNLIATPFITVQWDNVAGATRFEIWRSDSGAAVTQVGNAAQNVLFFQDNGVNTTTDYTYVVFACNGPGALDCTASPTPFTTSLKVVWPIKPIASEREVLHGFNEVLAWAGARSSDGTAQGYHDGVDLNRTTTGAAAGNDLLAAMGGVIVSAGSNPDADNAFIAVAITVIDPTGTVVNEFTNFSHVSDDPATPILVAAGQTVAPGQKLGNVGIRHFNGDFTDHIHCGIKIGAFSGTFNVRHFLSIFTNNADRDPQGNAPTLFDENGDGKVVLYRDRVDPTKYLDYDHDTKPVFGAFDIEVEVTDQQGTNPRQAPIDLSYWIEGPLPSTGPDADFDDIKSAAHPYKLYDFRTIYFGAGTPTACSLVSDIQDATNSGCKGLADCTNNSIGSCNSVIKEGSINFPWPVLHHFSITHASAEDGMPANVKMTEYWETRAEEDNAGETPMPANYASKTTTTKPNKARFPDGDYNIHVLASDLVHANVDLKDVMVGGKKPLENVRIENFPPFVKDLTVYEDKDNNAGTQVDADHPGCEEELYKFHHDNPDAYPGAAYLATSQKDTFAPAGRKLCVRVRFSEGMDPAWPDFRVELDPQGGAGAPPIAFAGAFAKTYTTNDTWKGSVTVAADPSGNSDSDILDPSKDAVIRVKARDLKDRNNTQRGMDENADGTPEGDSADENHRIKLDASTPMTTIDVSP